MQDKIRKWDEVHGVIETEIGLLECELVEAAGVSPSISRNYLRIIEDAVEQNDNSFDGIINNEPKQKEEEQKKSIIEKLHEYAKAQDKPKPTPTAVAIEDRALNAG